MVDRLPSASWHASSVLGLASAGYWAPYTLAGCTLIRRATVDVRLPILILTGDRDDFRGPNLATPAARLIGGVERGIVHSRTRAISLTFVAIAMEIQRGSRDQTIPAESPPSDCPPRCPVQPGC